jgi:hypothetical protein
MRRILVRLTMAVVMAAMLASMTIPAFGAANSHPSCPGAAHSNQSVQGAAGDWHSQVAKEGASHGGAQSNLAKEGPQGQQRDTTGSLYPSSQECMTA